jgi:hypothetical protein
MEENIKEKHIRNAYKDNDSLKCGFKPYTSLCEGDEVISNEEDIKNWCKTYSHHLLNAATAECDTSLNNAHTNEAETKQEVENGPPDILDTEIAIRSMRNNKAPGTDNIPIEHYKKGGQLLINMLHSLVKRIW